MIFSDRTIREAIEAGKIQIDPFEPSYVQPSSVDLRVGNGFRVFVNHRYSQIDPRDPQPDLTQLVEVEDGEAFMLHPGEFVLGSTLERVKLGTDVVARLEGKSSLGRLGLLIHSSLPGSEPVLIRAPDGSIRWRPIQEIVRKGLIGDVVAFDPDTFETSFHPITDRFEGPEDRIFEVRLASGRSLRVTAGHNLFTLDPEGELTKVRTGALIPGSLVAIPRQIPGPEASSDPPVIDLLDLMPETGFRRIVLEGSPIAALFADYPEQVRELFENMGIRHFDFYRSRSRLPAHIALQFGDLDRTGLRVSFRQSRRSLPSMIPVTGDVAWLLGLYVAEGYRRDKQVIWSNTDQGILDRVEATLLALGLPVYRAAGAITCSSSLLSRIIGWLEIGDGSHHKRVPPAVFGWPDDLIRDFVDGFVDGDGSREKTRVSLWTSSEGLVEDFLALLPRLGLRASASLRERGGNRLFQVSVPRGEHKLLTAVPLPDRLLIELRRAAGMSQADAAKAVGARSPSSISNLETRSGGRDAVRLATLRGLRAAYNPNAEDSLGSSRLQRLIEGGLLWDRVVEVRDTGRWETIFDIEVMPMGRKVQNFLAGRGGVFAANTAGFVDPGFEGHITLELSNVATLPIAIYPGMKIGQISFYQMTTEADAPYGSPQLGSKYQGQSGPTASRSHRDFSSEG